VVMVIVVVMVVVLVMMVVVMVMVSFMYRNKALSLSEDKAHRVSAAHGQVMTRPTSPPRWFLLDMGRFFWVAGSSRMV